MPELMDGVTYLYTIPAEKPWSLVWCAVVAAALSALTVAISLWLQYADAKEIVITVLVFSVLGGAFGYGMGRIINNAMHPERYVVTVSETVRMNEFHEKYEIVGLKENAYIIQMRENEQ